MRRCTCRIAVGAAVATSAVLLAAPASASSTVVYSIDSDGSLSTVSYFNQFNIQVQLSDVRPPWRMSFDTDESSQILIISATTTGQHVSCSIIVDGVVRDEESAEGPGANVHCGRVAS